MEKKTREDLRDIGIEIIEMTRHRATHLEILEILKNLVISTVLGYPVTKDKKKQMFDGLLKHMKEVFDDALEEVEED